MNFAEVLGGGRVSDEIHPPECGENLPIKNLFREEQKTNINLVAPSKNPSKNLVFTENPYRCLLRTLLRSTYL